MEKVSERERLRWDFPEGEYEEVRDIEVIEEIERQLGFRFKHTPTAVMVGVNGDLWETQASPRESKRPDTVFYKVPLR